MLSVQQFERIRQLIQPVSAIGAWLLPKALLLAASGCAALAWLVFYLLQFWDWHYWWLAPLTVLAAPVLIITLWLWMLLDLKGLPDVLTELQGVLTDQPQPAEPPKIAAETTAGRARVRQLPSMLGELWTLVQGVDALRTVVAHVILLINPVSWLVLALSAALIGAYVCIALMTLLFYLG